MQMKSLIRNKGPLRKVTYGRSPHRTRHQTPRKIPCESRSRTIGTSDWWSGGKCSCTSTSKKEKSGEKTSSKGETSTHRLIQVKGQTMEDTGHTALEEEEENKTKHGLAIKRGDTPGMSMFQIRVGAVYCPTKQHGNGEMGLHHPPTRGFHQR